MPYRGQTSDHSFALVLCAVCALLVALWFVVGG